MLRYAKHWHDYVSALLNLRFCLELDLASSYSKEVREHTNAII
ncbi:hypothetical protein Slin15195_G129760 [Septoria linicola]|uniref:Uncharacterized protein n=1 Tax=Septoria linicola TaxID=215465 RepID=A0A9Q9ER91_9PEZI|nr:hypothetical protein Slin14017_G128770 [Septoria linicola]USW59657.1 hypothetical protein Slin15195_G129760 [Septoria linicola]